MIRRTNLSANLMYIVFAIYYDCIFLPVMTDSSLVQTANNLWFKLTNDSVPQRNKDENSKNVNSQVHTAGSGAHTHSVSQTYIPLVEHINMIVRLCARVRACHVALRKSGA